MAMLTRDNILDDINKYQDKIDSLERKLEKITDDEVRRCVEQRLGDLKDNLYRHKLQARAWGLMPPKNEESD